MDDNNERLDRARRRLLGIGTLVVAAVPMVHAARILGTDTTFWAPDLAAPPADIDPATWLFFTDAERRMVDALVEVLIPADELSMSGKDAGCTVYIDRQMAGPYGTAQRRYMQGPFAPGLPTQGPQSPLTPADVFRQGLAALAAHCAATAPGKALAELTMAQREILLHELEHGTVAFAGPVGAVQFFNELLARTMEGFFADPIYGGNKEMVSWKMLGYPGAQYNYLDWVGRHNETYPHPPIGIAGSPAWQVRG